MEVDRNGLEVLGRDECLHLLGTSMLGRLGLTVGALPTVLPVNYRLIGDKVIFRTSIGTKLQAATTNAVVAFQVDDMDPLWHTGWSVVVTGVAREVTDPDELARLDVTRIPRWAPLGESRIVEVATEMVTGRRITAAAGRATAGHDRAAAAECNSGAPDQRGGDGAFRPQHVAG
jgi:nitroimidazol reductase NimA-like FMN-containing flavoprotein (pyridoxamine 5'-phosphate oxidase superfamily)